MTCSKTSERTSSFQTVCTQHVTDLLQKNQVLLESLNPTLKATFAGNAQALLMKQESVQSFIHVNGNDVLVTTTSIGVDTGDIVLKGNIGPFPYELHLRIQIQDTTVTVTLTLTKPIQVGPYTYTFDLMGVTRNSSGEIIGAGKVVPVDGQMTTMGINWFCAAKCGGLTILPTLIECLPALVGGPAAYVACVTAKIGSSDAAQIATCIASQCV